MTQSQPAWSEAFTPDRLRTIPAMRWSGPMSRRWAWGDGRVPASGWR